MQRVDTRVGSSEKHVQLTPHAVMKIKKELLDIVNHKDNKNAIVKSVSDLPTEVSKLNIFVPLCMGFKGSPTASLLRDYYRSLQKEMTEIMQDTPVEIQFFVHFPTRKDADIFLSENPDIRSFCMSIEDLRDTQKWQSLNESRERLSAKYPKDWAEKLDKTCADFEKKLNKQGVEYKKAESEVYFSQIAGDWASMMPSEQQEVSLVLSDRHHDHLPVWKFVNRHAEEMRWKSEQDRRYSADLSSLSDAGSLSDDALSIGSDSDSEGTRRIYKDNFRYVQFTVEPIPQLQQKSSVATSASATTSTSSTSPILTPRTTNVPSLRFFKVGPKSFVPASRVSNDSGYQSSTSMSATSSTGSNISNSGSNPSSDDEAIGIITENFGIAIATMAEHGSVEKAVELYHASCQMVSTRVSKSSMMFQHPNPAICAGLRSRSNSAESSPSTSPK